MATASTATVTGVIGPGKAVTTTTFTGVTSFSVDCENEILTLYFSGSRPPMIVSVAAAATWTITVSGNDYTLTVAN